MTRKTLRNHLVTSGIIAGCAGAVALGVNFPWLFAVLACALIAGSFYGLLYSIVSA